MVKRAAANSGGNDVVYTPLNLCRSIIQHYEPKGSAIEPCEGSGNFVKALKESTGISEVTHFDITTGTDYLGHKTQPHNWLITNPPFSKLHLFLRKAMQDDHDNIILLCYANTFLMNGKMKSLVEFNYSIDEIAFVKSPHYHSDSKTFVQDEQWPQSGFALAATCIRKQKTKSSKPLVEALKISYLDW